MSLAATSVDLETASRELHALGLRLPEPVETLYGQALAAELVGLPDCLAIDDLLAISGQAPSRALHALLLLVYGRRSQGSLCLSLDPAGLAADLAPLAPDAADLATAIWRGLDQSEWGELVGDGLEPFRPLVRSEDGRFLYLRKYFLCERRLRERLAVLTGTTEHLVQPDPAALRELVREVGQFRAFRLNAAQSWGVYLALRRNFVVVTGGPGTGKTTLVTALLRALDRCGVRSDHIALVAPTGRAAQRLTEALRQGLNQAEEPADRLERLGTLEGTTIHRLLRFQARRGAFAFDEDFPLPQEAVIVDEVSMVDVALMERLLAAVRPGTLVVLLGDKDQLPSVEAGAVLAELIPRTGTTAFSPELAKELAELAPGVPVTEDASGALADRVVVLTESNRVAGAVYQVAQRVNAGDQMVVGELPVLPAGRPIPWPTDQAQCVRLAGAIREPAALTEVLDDWLLRHWLEPTDGPPLARLLHEGGEVLATTEEGDHPVLAEALNRLARASILTVLRRGPFGVEGLNQRLAERLRRRLDPGVGRSLLFAGAPVLVTRNTPGLGLFNGDLGLTVRLPDGRLVVLFRRGGEVVRVPAPLLPPHELAFALTVHKSQGSEYGNVLLVVPPVAGHRLLTREIVYTAITRSRGMVAIWSSPQVLAEAIGRRVQRSSALGLWDAASAAIGVQS